MSRRDKQADMRRRMAEARAKLVTSSHANASDLDNEIATDIPIKKRPLPSAGGILKKPKYSSTPAVPPPPPQTESKAEDDKSIDENNALGSLMADYGDSSDEDTNTNTKAASTSNIDDQKQISEPMQPTINNDKEQQMPKKKKKKKKKKDKAQLEDTVDKTEAEGKLKSDEGGGNDKPTEVSDEVWDEFNALLDDDNDEVAKDSSPLKSEETSNSIPVEGETSTNSETPTTKKKKKKKGSKKKKKDIYDNDEINTVEQASYEARLARLMLLKSKKTQHKMSTKTDENNEKLLSASTNEFYNGGLAFQQDDEDEEDENDNEGSIKAKTTANLKANGDEDAADDSNTTTTSNTVTSSISAPSVSLAAILRGRRDQARQLSRGNDKIDTANDSEEEDESWF